MKGNETFDEDARVEERCVTRHRTAARETTCFIKLLNDVLKINTIFALQVYGNAGGLKDI